MLAGVYSSSTLNGNWLEERQAPPKPDLERVVRPQENEVRTTRFSRRKQGKSYGVPDDGFPSVTTSSQHIDFCPLDERGVNMVDAPLTKFLDSSGVPEVSYDKRRPVVGPRSGFRALLNRHAEGEDARYWDTSTGDAFVTPKEFDEEGDIKTLRSKAAGVPCVQEEKIYKQALSGEPPNIDLIPMQRSWMANFDPGLREFLKAGGTQPPLPAEDNELSLPLGKGMQAKITAELKSRGTMARRSTPITTGHQKSDGIYIFDDE